VLFNDAQKGGKPRVAQDRLDSFIDLPLSLRRLGQHCAKGLRKVPAGEPIVFGCKLLRRHGIGLALPLGFHGQVRSRGL